MNYRSVVQPSVPIKSSTWMVCQAGSLHDYRNHYRRHLVALSVRQLEENHRSLHTESASTPRRPPIDVRDTSTVNEDPAITNSKVKGREPHESNPATSCPTVRRLRHRLKSRCRRKLGEMSVAFRAPTRRPRDRYSNRSTRRLLQRYGEDGCWSHRQQSTAVLQSFVANIHLG
jgi:hypothetical protein